jgi:hypothetical protein
METLNAKEYMTANVFIVLISVLVVVISGVYFYQSYQKMHKHRLAKEAKEYTANHCPDYWELVRREKDDKGRDYSVCKNVHKLGSCALDPERNTFTFDDEIFVNPNSGDLSKCKWAKQCGVSWSGYDNLCA